MAHAEHAAPRPRFCRRLNLRCCLEPCWSQSPQLQLDHRKICGIIEGKTPVWWWWCFLVACFIASFTVAGITYVVATALASGVIVAPSTGDGDRELRVLDRYRPRWYADFRHLVPAAQKWRHRSIAPPRR